MNTDDDCEEYGKREHEAAEAALEDGEPDGDPHDDLLALAGDGKVGGDVDVFLEFHKQEVTEDGKGDKEHKGAEMKAGVEDEERECNYEV